jgi:hypothetical protein
MEHANEEAGSGDRPLYVVWWPDIEAVLARLDAVGELLEAKRSGDYSDDLDEPAALARRLAFFSDEAVQWLADRLAELRGGPQQPPSTSASSSMTGRS